jgi:hypothetical protein
MSTSMPPRAVHFLADNLFDFTKRAQAQRQKSINAARELADQPGAQQQFVRNDFRVSRGFAQGRDQGLCPLHVTGNLTTKERGNEEFYFWPVRQTCAPPRFR